MLDLLWVVPTIPFLGFLILAIFGKRLSRAAIAYIGVGSSALSALVALLIATQFITNPTPGHLYEQTLWIWMDVAGFKPGIAFYLDALSLVFMLVITIVGFLIHLYSAEFMLAEEGYSRFFAYMNLFIGSMLTLVMADNLLLLYLGWEGVGLCSYLLIGFWYKDEANGYAARKAFVVTRVGDTAMAVGLFILYTTFGTLNIQGSLHQAAQHWVVGSTLAITTAALLLGGALGKSAQLPLQTWLPDAMAGPTPVSALIHAATMVTAGVYLIARMHVIFTLAPLIQTIIAVIGTVTLLLSGFTALTQVDIKRVLAYSTISQIGYMFLALGVGAWSAAIFHFMTHAFFKALLFLAAGVIIITLHHEHNMFKMGGLRRQLPVTFWTFLIGSASLSAVPLVTAGFFSKDLILWNVWIGEQSNIWLWAGGLVGAFITALYTFRMVFITFFGTAGMQISHQPGYRLKLPLIILAVLSICGGYLQLPHSLGNVNIFSDFIQTALPSFHSLVENADEELILGILSALVALSGIFFAYILYQKYPTLLAKLSKIRSIMVVRNYWFSGWGFDWLYDHLFVMPLIFLARINKNDIIDLFYSWLAWINRQLNRILTGTQNGKLRWYAMGIVLGAIITITIVVVK